MKGQISFVEFIISFTIFSIFVAYLFFSLSSYMPAYLKEIRNERVRAEAYLISQLLVNDPGEPMNWGMAPGPPPAGCPSDWWDNNWQYRMNLTFDNSGQNEGLNNFPVLVKLTTSFDYSKAKADGTDLRFIDSDGTELKYHIEKWNPGGESFIWVKVPNIPASSSADYMWMYYGNSAALDVQDEANSYDNNFVGVWHLNESSGTIYDSTINDNDGTAFGNPTYVEQSLIAGAYFFNRTKWSQYINVPNKPSIQLGGENYTIEAWVKPLIPDSSASIVSKLTDTSDKEYALGLEEIDLSVTVEMEFSANDYWFNVNADIKPERWYYITSRYYEPTRQLDIYVNASLIGSDTVPADTQKKNDPLSIGRWAGTYNSDYFNGTIDEIRISNTTRSESWIKASYLTMTDQFINYGGEEGCAGVPTCPSDWWNSNWQKRIQLNISETTGYDRSFEPFDIWIDFPTDPINATKEVRVTQCSPENSLDCTTETEIPSQVYNKTTVGGVDDSANVVFEADVSSNSWRIYYVYYNYPSASEPSYTTDLVYKSASGVVTVNTTYIYAKYGKLSYCSLIDFRLRSVDKNASSTYGMSENLEGGGAGCTPDYNILRAGPVFVDVYRNPAPEKINRFYAYNSFVDDIIENSVITTTTTGASPRYYAQFSYTAPIWDDWWLGNLNKPILNTTEGNTYCSGNRCEVQTVSDTLIMLSETNSPVFSLYVWGWDIFNRWDAWEFRPQVDYNAEWGYWWNASASKTVKDIRRFGMDESTDRATLMPLYYKFNNPLQTSIGDEEECSGVVPPPPPPPPGLTPKRIGLSDMANKTNLISLGKVAQLNTMCQGDGYYNVKAFIGTEQDFSIYLLTRPDEDLLLSCYPPRTIYRGINISIKRFVTFSDRGCVYPAGWWNTNWKYRMKLTFDNSGQSESLNNFPVLVKFSSSNFDYSKAKSDGIDLRFIDPDGTELRYHIEKWNSAGESFVWVKVPNIPASSSADYMWMYYGNPSAVDAQDEENTYDSNFVGVWHFSESSGTLYDSTVNNNDGTNNGATYGANGMIDAALGFGGIGSNDYVEVPVPPSDSSLDLTDSLTFGAWIYPLGWGENNWGRILDKVWTTTYGFAIANEPAHPETFMLKIEGSIYYASDYSLTLNDWQYIVATFDKNLPAQQIKLFVNGNLITTETRAISIPVNTESLYIGNRKDLDRDFDGTIDELKISNVARSAPWIKASYLTMTDQFINYGLEETCYFSTATATSDKYGELIVQMW